MSEERKILEMLSSGQINVDEAEGLLEALRDSRPLLETVFDSRGEVDDGKVIRTVDIFEDILKDDQPKSIEKLLRIKVVYRGDKPTFLNFDVPIKAASTAETVLPAKVKDVIGNRGIKLNELLGSLNETSPVGEVLKFQARDKNEQAFVLFEVTS